MHSTSTTSETQDGTRHVATDRYVPAEFNGRESILTNAQLMNKVLDHLQSSREGHDDDICVALSCLYLLMDDPFYQVRHNAISSTTIQIPRIVLHPDDATSSRSLHNAQSMGSARPFGGLPSPTSDTERLFTSHDLIGWDWATFHQSLGAQVDRSDFI